ncbi:MAG: 23S rRNA (pseudouridine(1915)-N(3))-methyltransferase RlmH [Paludibacteraceae bacterium]|nr:23S rRNA (pseudouridine(1915)-N(3))-methyltransferase RlmH [Paludibacteraceae bacterium]
MKITLLAVGKTTDSIVESLTNIYIKRLEHYTDFKFITIPELKNTKSLSEADQKQKEGELILKAIPAGSRVVLLDEKGAEYTSVEFSQKITAYQNSGVKNVVFVIGGPYGFSPDVYALAGEKISLSKMTFSHQMVRAIFTEQLYRAFTIIKGEPYHHQ